MRQSQKESLIALSGLFPFLRWTVIVVLSFEYQRASHPVSRYGQRKYSILALELDLDPHQNSNITIFMRYFDLTKHEPMHHFGMAQGRDGGFS